MTVANYNSLVQKTFCENAIRSVVMIDDDFLTYSESIRALNNEVDLDYNKIDSSKRAATLESFFQSKNMICDVDNGSVNFDVDRIRKSDLIIVDYHLDNNAPDKTLKLLQDLKDSDHLNMIVIYTRENLETVWMQISSTLKGALDINSLIIDYDNEDVQSYWEDVVLPNLNDNGNKALTRDEIIAYIKDSKPCRRIKRLIHDDAVLEDQKDKNFIAKMIAEYAVSRNAIISSNTSGNVIRGDESGVKWIQCGNIFVSLFHKVQDDHENDGDRIWQTLNDSLIEWKPSYYQLIKSEIQNAIEAEALSFVNHLANDHYGQAAWLNEILKSDSPDIRCRNIDFVFGNLSEELYQRLKNNNTLDEFIKSVFDSYSNEYANSGVAALLQYCSSKMDLPSNNDTYHEMYHALNMNLSSKNFEDGHISTGTIFFDTESNKWYLCVSAACDLVPTQGNDPHHVRLSPHRLIKVLELFNASQSKALPFAEHSKYIYVMHKNQRKYLSIFEGDKTLPVVDYMVVLNHGATVDGEEKNIISAVFLSNMDGNVQNVPVRLKLKSQLRTGYAERYQAIASQYSSRIGVDYVSMMLP
ncbi:response regulator receiver domain [Escherichia coli]